MNQNSKIIVADRAAKGITPSVWLVCLFIGLGLWAIIATSAVTVYNLIRTIF